MMAALDIKTLEGLTLDSRAVKPGYLFAALPGTKVDGRDYIPQAIEKGAKVVLAPMGTTLPEAANNDVLLITDENPKKRFALMVAEFYKDQPEQIVAVTGTNGKTSVVTFCQQFWAGFGYKAASVGTLGIKQSGIHVDFENSDSMTTPDPVGLHREFSLIKSLGVEHLAMEASSHGLDQFRLDGVKIKAAGFTSFSRDHMDYHKDEAEYLSAKLRLFSEVVERGGTAVLNADIKEFDKIKAAASGLNVWTYGENGSEFKIKSIESDTHGQHIELEVFGKHYDFLLPLVGRFQVYNALCAMGLVLSEDKARADEAIKILSTIKSVPGRLQLVSGHPKGAGIYVDYAHTPDAIETVLKALRPHASGKLVCIFGCGGDRDAGKRPLMGKAAADYADIAIVTDDNPRSEDPATIRAAAAAASPKIFDIPGRREAIKYALSLLEEGDVLALTGKGHEQGQQFATHKEEFCDVTETKKAIEEMKK